MSPTTLDSVQGNARLAEASVAEETAAALDATDKDVGIGGAGLAAATIELGLVDELRIFRYPVVVGGGTPFLPPVTEEIALELIETRTFGSRVIYERYGRARDEPLAGALLLRVQIPYAPTRIRTWGLLLRRAPGRQTAGCGRARMTCKSCRSTSLMCPAVSGKSSPDVPVSYLSIKTLGASR
jgi:RibD C-terminal domain